VTTPLVGTEFFRVRLTGAAAIAPAVLFVGFQPAAIPLDLIGMVGCDLLVNPVAVTITTTADVNGDALITISHLLGPIDLYMQWAHVAIGANPLGVLMTDGLRAQIR
jgi:hypothetical protein